MNDLHHKLGHDWVNLSKSNPINNSKFVIWECTSCHAVTTTNEDYENQENVIYYNGVRVTELICLEIQALSILDE